MSAGAPHPTCSQVHPDSALPHMPSAAQQAEAEPVARDLLPPMGIRNDRDMLNYLMVAFDHEISSCPRCGYGEPTKNMDSASFLRDYLAAAPKAPAEKAGGLTAADYEKVLTSHRRLVRELDVLLNGDDGAAMQANLCDIVSQVRREGIRPAAGGAGDLTASQALIALGKYASGYRPGQDGWTPEDDAALQVALGGRPAYAGAGDQDAARLAKLLQMCTEAKTKFGPAGTLRQVTMTFKNSVETSHGYRDELRKLVDELTPTYAAMSNIPATKGAADQEGGA